MRNIITACLLAFALTVQISGQEYSKKIDEILKAYHEKANLEGSILVAQSGQVIFKKGFGLANRAWRIRNHPEVSYDVGSLTKTFTAVITLMLVQGESLDLADKITDYLPEYRKDTGDKITIHHLLCQSSGLPPYWTREFVRTHSRNEFDDAYFIKTFCSGDLEFEPGTNARYSDTNYYLLGKIIEVVTGKTYATVLQEMLFDKIGMRSSGYMDHTRIIPQLASGYISSRGHYTNGSFNNRKNVDAAGASYSTVGDLLLFDRSLYSNTLLSKKYRELLFKIHSKMNLGRRQVDYGYGWQLTPLKFDKIDHEILVANAGGNNEGFTALIYRIPSEQYFIAMLTNSGPSFFNEQLHEVGRNIISILYSQPYTLPRHSIAGFLESHLSEYGIDKARAKYKSVIKDDDYEMEEQSINRLGYDLLRQGKYDEAIFVLELNVEAFPQSFNVYDSLAEAFMANGNEEKAIENYEKSLRLNPDNENAKAMLRRLGEE